MATQKNNIHNWSDRHYSARDQARVLSFLSDRVDYYEAIQFTVPFDRLFTECATECQVSKSTARCWWLHYEQYGELPIETTNYMKRMQKKHRWLPKTAKISPADLETLRAIIMRRPDLFLDEIAIVFGIQVGKFYPHSTLWSYITNYLGFSLQTLTEYAAQQCEETRSEFKHILQMHIHENPELLIMVDETHWDCNTARRRRGYGARNSGGVK